jgi:hypothetical protein
MSPGAAADTPAIDVRNLREFFRDAVHEALEHRKVGVQDHTEHYVVNLLTMFARAEALFEPTPDGPRLKPLALMLAEAAGAPAGEQRSRALQRLGDVSLFVSGFLSHGFARRLVDIDYHIAMGGRAYGTLADHCGRGARARALAGVFAELAAKFQRLVDALNDVSEMSWRASDRDLLRLYEVWLKTGSPRALALLRERGVAPTPVPVGRTPH